MPRVIDPAALDGAAIGLDELADAFDGCGVDPRDEDGFAAQGVWLARLARNRHFLSDLAIAELERGFSGQAGNLYGAQALMLRPPHGRFALRASFWPARHDAMVAAAGPAAFFYDLPHDHNFSFLTVGYLGPGYWSDYYRFDGVAAGLPGDPAGLVFEERSRLDPGKVMLYRAHRDVHVQLPPDDFSVSINVMGGDPGNIWRTQYRFDIDADAIASPLTVAPSEALVTIAARLGGEGGVALAHEMLRRHPVPRMRATALRALAAVTDRDTRDELIAVAARDADALVAAQARLLAGEGSDGHPAAMAP